MSLPSKPSSPNRILHLHEQNSRELFLVKLCVTSNTMQHMVICNTTERCPAASDGAWGGGGGRWRELPTSGEAIGRSVGGAPMSSAGGGAPANSAMNSRWRGSKESLEQPELVAGWWCACKLGPRPLLPGSANGYTVIVLDTQLHRLHRYTKKMHCID